MPQPPNPAAALSFGPAAAAYDTGRPGYPDQLVADVLAYAGSPDPMTVEVGAGTGKATVTFAAAGVRMLCLEPDPMMAEVLRANTAGYPAVEVEVSAFEAWRPGGRRFDLLLAATSWHWVDRGRCWDLTLDALQPDGAVALCWNPLGVLDPGLHAELRLVDQRHGIADSSHWSLASDYTAQPGDWDPTRWPAPELASHPRFHDVREHRYRHELTYTTDDYLCLLDSTSTYRLLPPAGRERVLADTAAVLGRHGGRIELAQFTDLCLARVAPAPASTVDAAPA